MSAKSAEQDALSSRQISISRIVDAPRELVFDVFTNPAHVSNWWGPHGFSITTDEMDVRPGGVWRYVMHGPDGTDYDNFIQYKEVVRPERIVFGHGEDEASKACHWHTTVTFEPVGRKTRVTLTMLFPTAEQRDAVATSGAIEGGQQTLERFDTHLALQKYPSASGQQFEIRRTFAATPEAVWAAFSDAGALAQWWGPTGCKIEVAKLDFRAGGTFHYAMRFSSGAEMWGRFVYREVAAPRRLVWVSSFSDPGGGITRAPFLPEYPAEVLTIMTLEKSGSGTELTLCAVPLEASEAELGAFSGLFKSMQQGYGGTFDQLAEYLSTFSQTRA